MNARSIVCVSFLLACSGKGDSAEDVVVDAHPYAGAWTGSVNGYANFDASWETEPYCTGELYANVDNDGVFTGNGSCTITWGPAEGEVFDAEVTGEVDLEGAFSLRIELLFDTEERSWQATSVSGTTDGTNISARGLTLYFPSTGGDLEAYAGLDVSR